jgi:hypothetical protein
MYMHISSYPPELRSRQLHLTLLYLSSLAFVGLPLFRLFLFFLSFLQLGLDRSLGHSQDPSFTQADDRSHSPRITRFPCFSNDFQITLMLSATSNELKKRERLTAKSPMYSASLVLMISSITFATLLSRVGGGTSPVFLDFENSKSYNINRITERSGSSMSSSNPKWNRLGVN